MVDYLPSIHGALGSVPALHRKKKEEETIKLRCHSPYEICKNEQQIIIMFLALLFALFCLNQYAPSLSLTYTLL